MQSQEKVRATLLGNHGYAALVTPLGGGFSAYEGLAITRWTPDPLGEAAGPVCYLRDLESGAFWSIGSQPAGAGSLHCRTAGGTVQLAALHEDIAAQVDIAVAADAPLELRRIRVENRSSRPRRVELTTYAELVLNTPAADAGHPAFSRLFVQTAHQDGTLLAWRRLRSPDDVPLHVAQRLLASAPVSFETDRLRFIGRGRSLAAPAALYGDGTLAGTTGNVLDPVFAQRTILELEPGGTAEAALVLAAAREAPPALALADRIADPAAAGALLEHGARCAEVGMLGLPERWLAGIELAAELDVRLERAPRPRAAVLVAPAAAGADEAEDLQFFNGIGGFIPDGSEYVIRLRHAEGGLVLPPLPWTNCIANEELGCIVSERGAISTWAANSRENRITPWPNDPVSDPHVEALYLRDEATGAFWSPLPGPCPASVAHEVRHGFGYSHFRHTSHELEQEVTVFVPHGDPVRIARVRLVNRGRTERRLSLYSYAQLVLGGTPQETRGTLETAVDALTGTLQARNRARGEFSGRVAFAACLAAGDVALSVTSDRAAFLGSAGDVAAPAAVRDGGTLDGRTGTLADPCFAQRCTFVLPAGATFEGALLLGEAADESSVAALLARLGTTAAVAAALADTRAFWQELLGRVQVRTPVPALDLMVNGWLIYQNLACRMWGRTAFYQSGGAFGFRDQLQDSSALLWVDPARTRAQILLHAAHQFAEGDVLHWWHPPTAKGIRTRFSDDLLWLPLITAEYVRVTGDAAVLQESARFLHGAQLEPGEDEAFLFPEDAGESGTVYEHCCRAIDRSLAVGAHGLPLMGTGDWNDGMNRVGREGRGESVWLGFFLFDILHRFIPLCEARGDARAGRYRTHARALAQALNAGGWDGTWYRRAYYDSGVPLGAAANDECRIDTIAQAWAVLSGAAPPERAARALDAMEQHLVSEDEGIIRLLTPAFDRTPHDPGYIKGYLPGVRENGGQYTHGALWGVRALAQAGRAERAARLLEMLSPVSHTRTPAEVARYMVEPYVVAADVYGVEPHVGRGGWTWYTGSAGWLYRVALESVLGLQQREHALLVRPCIPRDWPGFEVTLRRPEATYRIRVSRHGEETRATLDGVPLHVADEVVRIPLTAAPGGEHEVAIELGAAADVRYRARGEPGEEWW